MLSRNGSHHKHASKRDGDCASVKLWPAPCRCDGQLFTYHRPGIIWNKLKSNRLPASRLSWTQWLLTNCCSKVTGMSMRHWYSVCAKFFYYWPIRSWALTGHLPSFWVRVGESLFPCRQTRIFLKMEIIPWRLKYNLSQTCMSKRMPSFKYSFTTLSSVISS